MASQYLGIHKATFEAKLLKPLPAAGAVSKQEIANFHQLFQSVVQQCTPQSVQLCRDWLLKYVFSSDPRISSFGKYLAAYSTSLSHSSGTTASRRPPNSPSAKRQRLHLLNLLNDLMHHFHVSPSGSTSNLKAHIAHIVSECASCAKQRFERHHAKLIRLLQIWKEKEFFPGSFIEKLHESIDQNSTQLHGPSVLTDSNVAGQGNDREAANNKPWLIPASHGEDSFPWEDLPVANFIDHIQPVSDELHQDPKIRGSNIRPLKFEERRGDPTFIDAAEDLIAEANAMYDENHDIQDNGVPDVDRMGQALVRDKATGKVIAKLTQYGWSLQRCRELMKIQSDEARQRNQQRGYKDHSRGRRVDQDARSRDSRSSRSISSRRYSSDSRSPRQRRRSYSPGSISARRGSRYSDGSRSRSRSPRSPEKEPPSSSWLGSRDQLTASHAAPNRTHSFQNQPVVTPQEQVDPQHPAQVPPPPPQYSAGYFQHNYPSGPHGPAPPPPSFHTGPWPPNMPGSSSQQPYPFPGQTSAPQPTPPPPPSLVPPPPPPPPPPSQGNWPSHRGSASRSFHPYPPRGSYRGRGVSRGW